MLEARVGSAEGPETLEARLVVSRPEKLEFPAALKVKVGNTEDASLVKLVVLLKRRLELLAKVEAIVKRPEVLLLGARKLLD